MWGDSVEIIGAMKEQLATLTAERDALRAEVERLKVFEPQEGDYGRGDYWVPKADKDRALVRAEAWKKAAEVMYDAWHNYSDEERGAEACGWLNAARRLESGHE